MESLREVRVRSEGLNVLEKSVRRDTRLYKGVYSKGYKEWA